ncbi:sigma-70 family RNA polymerase sigma factor [Streptomyces roseicoloratus]|uniref:sigma-70 family RNA polymerase sigma factor n=1 Tax=Streptomyces roseicoloratus TaxID=2508722 RepID=UPI001009F501|nr:sigma-70 family RNA polymerase sigma factor [Streptomyces roseicoloratus]
MHEDEHRTADLVEAARAGDVRAEDALVRAYMPLVYNIVGRALDGHADVDDLVQDTMVRALDGLPALRDPARFRSWLVAIAMNRVRRRWRENRQAPLPGLDRAAALADPAGDFTGLAILRLGLTGQRREVAEATRWLDEDDREVLSLWWLEAAGELSRAELAAALDIPPRHAAVRVQRMKERLETGRAVVRALAAVPPCPGLAGATATWDGRPSPLWRKRLARHLDACPHCAPSRSGLAPAEGLLVGLALVPPLLAWAGRGSGAPGLETAAATVPGDGAAPGAAAPAGADPAGPVSTGADPAGAGVTGAVPSGGGSAAVPAGSGLAGRPGLLVVGGAVVALGAALLLLVPSGPADRTLAQPSVTPPAAPVATRTMAPPPSPSPTPSPTPSRTTAPRPSTEEQVTRIVNRHRAAAGCGPLRAEPRLTAVARAFGQDMAERRYLSHIDPEGTDSGTRLTAEGYSWSAWAENLAQGQRAPASVVASWMADPPHRANLLDCRYRHTGVAAVPGPDGTIWVQELAAPGRS